MEEEMSAFQPSITITPAMVPAIGFANVLSRLLGFDLHTEAITTNQAADGGLICLHPDTFASLARDAYPGQGMVTKTEDDSLALNVRLVAPEAKLVDHYIDQLGLDADKARQKVSQEQQANATSAAALADVTINASSLTIFAAVRLVLMAYEEKFGLRLVDELPNDEELAGLIN